MGTYRFGIDSFHIASLRSAQKDTLYASTGLTVYNAAGGLHKHWGSHGGALGDWGTGDEGRLFLPWDEVSVPGPTPDNPDGGWVAWSFLLVNGGHKESGFVDVLNKAADSFAGALAGKVVEPGASAGAASLAYLAGFGGILAAQQVLNMLTADCDGQVAGGAFMWTAAELAVMTAGGKVNIFSEDNPGTNSPPGCGDNSHYWISYRVGPSTAGLPAGAPITAARVDDDVNAVVVGLDGSLEVTSVSGSGGGWTPISTIAPSGTARPRTPIALERHGSLKQFDALFAGPNGEVKIVYGRERQQGWTGPETIAPAGTIGSNTPIALAVQGDHDQLDAVFAGPNGEVKLMWVEGTGGWHGPETIAPAGTIGSNTPIALAVQGDHDQLDAVFAGPNGEVKLMWVEGTGGWHGPETIAPAGTIGSNTPIALAVQGDHDQLDAVFAGPNGEVKLMWVEGTGGWHAPETIAPAGTIGSNTPIALAVQGDHDQLDAVFAGPNGEVKLMWVEGTGGWHAPETIAPAGTIRPNTPITLVRQGFRDQLDAIFVAPDGSIKVMWVEGTGGWHVPEVIAPARQGALAHAQARVRALTDEARALWSAGDRDGAITRAREGESLARDIAEYDPAYPGLGEILVDPLATYLAEAGRRDEAITALREAVDVFTRLGDAAKLDTAKQRLAGLGVFIGRWTMWQTNGFLIQLDVNPADGAGNFDGSAAYDGSTGAIRAGQLGARDVVFEIHWIDGRKGRLTGHLDDQGIWSGDSVDMAVPESTARWSAKPS
ncbi:tetratricopeptide repeat protein [Nocardia iowensis]|uniref:Tetratricopeptide repeat protein n=1 Tax=Nocardia iowensis TaxID=204891 RepID=A0ABX8RIW7_NOCIO|nr:tetratricopeptide repeat protein [Nocardia iowensis]QXN88817.1 tetratricopeptide repeat protein [Nocardia iowensis]